MAMDEIYFKRSLIQFGMMIISDYIENKRFPISKTAQYYVRDSINFFENVRASLMECLYPEKKGIDYELFAPIGEKFVEINDAILPVIDGNSRKEMLNRVRKIKGIESQLKDMKENPKSFYQREDAEGLAEICKKIKDVISPPPVQIF